MQCEDCQQRKANIFWVDVRGDREKALNLCEACAAERGSQQPNGTVAGWTSYNPPDAKPD
jgi:protein-arginine kinase activator protein McsA